MLSRRRSLAAIPWVSLCACTSRTGSAPDFEGRTLEGQPFTRASLQGRPVLIQFWTTWCGYCRRDQAAMDTLAYEYLGKIHVLAVNVGEESGTVRAYLSATPRRGQMVLSSETNLAEVFRPGGLPYYVMLSGESEVLGVLRGSAGEAGLRRLVAKAGLAG